MRPLADRGRLWRWLATLVWTPALLAQASPVPGHWEYVSIRSGVHANPYPVETVVHRDFVTVPANTPWVRLYFAKAWLDRGSYLRIVSLRDGDIMTMRQEHLAQWSFSSAYFNGNSVMIELVAGPNTARNFVEIDKVMAGDTTSSQPESLCSFIDNRGPTADARVGRIDPVGCTGWIIDVPAAGNDKCHLSAGHCARAGEILEFDVPASNANCGLNHPPASRQFAIDFANSRWVNGGIGNDHWVFRCFANPVTGLTTFQTQGAAFDLAAAMPALFTDLRVTGFGTDGSESSPGPATSCGCPGTGGTRNQTLQTDVGPLVQVYATHIDHYVDTCGGNSGSPVIDTTTGLGIAIHTHGGCDTPPDYVNKATKITNAGLQADVAAVCGPGAGNQLPLPPFATTFAANLTRGFWFQAPLAFVIVGVRVPDESAQGVQCVEINRMVAAPPANPASIQPAQLFYANNQPSGAILPCNVLVNAGDFIGVLGACGTTTMHNSYGPLGTFASSILGNPVTLTRLLMQNNLSTTGGNQPCSSEPHGPIGRVEVYIAPAAGAATAIPYGTGCVARHTSFYEDFANAAAFDLSNTAMTMINNGSSYTMATGLNGFVAPSANAVSLNLTDDSQTTVQLAGAFPYPGGTTTALTVCSNGFVSVANGNGTPFTPAVSNMLAFPQTAWGDWHDYLPAGPGPVGQVMFEQIGNVAYVTWNAVNDYGNPVPNTWQLQFDRGNGSVHFALQAMSLGGNGHLVFHSPGGPSLDPGNRDISATLAGGFATSPIDIAPLTLTATTRPVSGTNCNMLTANIPAASPFGAVQIGLTQYDPGIDLGALGMATCRRYADGTATLLFVGAGPTATLAFAIPPGFAGLHVYAQSLVFCPAAGLTVLGAISSNGLDLGIGNQ